MTGRRKESWEGREMELILLFFLALAAGTGIFLFQNNYVTAYVWQAVSWGAAAFLLVVLAYLDWRFERLPNPVLSLLLVTELLCLIADKTGFLTSTVQPFRFELLAEAGWLERGLGMLLPVVLIGAVNRFYRGTGIGAGDVKLFLILGFAFGYEMILRLMLISFLLVAGAMLTAIRLNKANRKSRVPLGPAICAAFLVCGCFL